MSHPLTSFIARSLAAGSRSRLCVIGTSALLVSCAALHAPVDFEPVEFGPVDPPHASAPADSSLRLEAVEGRPVGLVLRFWCVREVSEDVWLEVFRREGGAPAERIRSVRLDERLRARLAAEGLEFLDRSVPVESTPTYQIRLRASDENAPAHTLAVSKPLQVAWQNPPERPERVHSSSKISGVVELRWTAPKITGALIFRRDVLDDGARSERLVRLGPQARGTFVDRGVEPGGVYAYQVALAVDTGTTVQFGRPSQEIYVTVRAAP